MEISNHKMEKSRISQMLIRFLTSISIFAVTVFFTPNFHIASFPILILSSIMIILLDYLMAIITGIHDIPLGRGLVGFTSACIIIYITQFFVSGYYISIISSLIAAAIYGIIDSMLPNSAK
ncbi:MAG: phage holin family protein [Clostridia bacterium]|nr:phage holin family protein [Clostridia bacterium]